MFLFFRWSEVLEVNAEVGQKVKANDILLTYDTSDLENTYKQAKIQYDNTLLNKADLLNQKKDIEEELSEIDEKIYALDGSSNPEDIASLQTLIKTRKSMQTISDEKLKLMENSISLAKIQLDSAYSRLNEAKDGIKAEFDGVVTKVNAIAGSPLSMGQPAIIVQQLDNLKGIVYFGKYDAAKIRIDQSVTLNYGNRIYEGRVSFIEPVANKDISMGSSDASIMAEIDIINPDENLKVNFDVNADILVGEVSGVLKLPIECLRYGRDNNISVFVVKDGRAILTTIKTGIQSDVEIQIIEGLKEGDIVISTPPNDLTDGAAVLTEGESK